MLVSDFHPYLLRIPFHFPLPALKLSISSVLVQSCRVHELYPTRLSFIVIFHTPTPTFRIPFYTMETFILPSPWSSSRTVGSFATTLVPDRSGRSWQDRYLSPLSPSSQRLAGFHNLLASPVRGNERPLETAAHGQELQSTLRSTCRSVRVG